MLAFFDFISDVWVVSIYVKKEINYLVCNFISLMIKIDWLTLRILELRSLSVRVIDRWSFCILCLNMITVWENRIFSIILIFILLTITVTSVAIRAVFSNPIWSCSTNFTGIDRIIRMLFCLVLLKAIVRVR